MDLARALEDPRHRQRPLLGIGCDCALVRADFLCRKWAKFEIAFSPIPDENHRSTSFFFRLDAPLPDKPVIYCDSSRLLCQDIFTVIFYTLINNRVKIAKTGIMYKLRFFSVSSSLPQAGLATGSSAGS
jgi:hypothetical protein